jgi:hypothetical protein
MSTLNSKPNLSLLHQPINQYLTDEARLDIRKFSEEVFLQVSDPILKYGIARLLQDGGLRKANNFQVKKGKTYIKPEIATILEKNIETLLKLKRHKQMEFLLTQEYGYLLPQLKNQKWSIKYISPASVYLGADNHKKNLNQELQNDYQNLDVPVGVCLREGKRYRLVDGYHRFSANASKEKFFVIVNEGPLNLELT